MDKVCSQYAKGHEGVPHEVALPGQVRARKSINCDVTIDISYSA